MKSKSKSRKKKAIKRSLRRKKSIVPFSSPPGFKHTELYRWADYFELVCIFHQDKSITKGDILAIMTPLLKDSIIDRAEFESSDDETIDTILTEEPKMDQYKFFGDELFKMLEYRSIVYEQFYPFKVKGGNLLELKSTITIKCKLYIYLLCCSNLLFFKDYLSVFTKEFEILSKESLKRFASSRTEIHSFGANIKPTVYSGNLYTKLVKLATDLNCELIARKEDFSARDTGDGGLDIVAWFPFKDRKWSRLIFLIQCKCSEEWVDLRFSSSLDAWLGKINFKHSINNMNFIPMCYRRQNGAWHKNHHVSGTILVDRQRMIDCLGDNLSFFKSYSSIKSINKMLDLV